MEMCYITFRSVTYAQRGEQVLRSAGIGSNLQRTPKWMQEQGCGYCLRLRLDQVQRAVEQLRQSGAGRLWRRHGGGQTGLPYPGSGREAVSLSAGAGGFYLQLHPWPEHCHPVPGETGRPGGDFRL